MPAATRTERVSAHDGGAFDARVALPAGESGPAVLLLQEIFGVNDYIEDAADRLAGLGYVVLAPDLFWRIEPGIALPHDEAGLKRAMGYMAHFDVESALGDCDAALDALRGLPEVSGLTGVLGFCLGGRLAHHVAARSSPDAAVCYYGSGIGDSLDEGERIACPVLYHYGGRDPYITRAEIERVRTFASRRQGMEVYVQEDAGHAFDNHMAPMFSQPEAAARAWELTAEFLRRTLPV